MKKKVIAFDCDGVLADFQTPLVEWHNQKYGTKNSVSDIKVFSFAHLWGCDIKEELRRADEFYGSEYFSDLPVIEGALEGIRIITDNINNVALTLTARPENIHDMTRKWFRRKFPGKFNGIYFSKPHGLEGNGYLEKYEWCKKLCADFIIEDSVDNAIKCHEMGIRAIVFNQPWNESYTLPRGIKRAKNWEELTEMLI